MKYTVYGYLNGKIVMTHRDVNGDPKLYATRAGAINQAAKYNEMTRGQSIRFDVEQIATLCKPVVEFQKEKGTFPKKKAA